MCVCVCVCGVRVCVCVRLQLGHDLYVCVCACVCVRLQPGQDLSVCVFVCKTLLETFMAASKKKNLVLHATSSVCTWLWLDLCKIRTREVEIAHLFPSTLHRERS